MILQGSCGEDRRGGLLHGIPVYPLEGTCHLFLIGSHLPLDWIPTWWAGSAVGTMPSFAKSFLTPWLPTRGRNLWTIA